MSVEVEILKGVSKGKRKRINPIHAKALAHVGFLRIIEEADESTEPTGTNTLPRTKRVYRRKDMVAEA